MTFPAASGGERGMGVDYYHADGCFDRKSRTNLAEAELVARLVFEDIRRYPGRSLGVVAFSVSQQNLIDSIILKMRQQDSSFEEFFSAEREQPFFVKNLETVQGDERDTIIFSVAYGRDEQGRLLQTFGPLNRQGGERRLNVAVTRARQNVQLVSSMHACDIDMGRSSSEGVRVLKEYLDYAERGGKQVGSGLAGGMEGAADTALEEEIASFLRNRGYVVETRVGCGSAKVDIAVKRDDGSYALAVECDGAGYRDAANARDRDRLRPEQLERMGWQYYRLWTTDWFKNVQVEQERLLKAAEEAVSGGRDAGKAPSPAPEAALTAVRESLTEAVPEVREAFLPYEEADVRAIAGIYGNSPSRLHDMLQAILATEAPLAEERLLRRIPFLFGKEKLTPTVRQSFEQAMRGCEGREIVRREGFLYRADMTDYHLRVPGIQRELRQVALEELAAGMYAILRQNIRSDRGSLYHALVTALGFSRAGDAARERLDAALALLGDKVATDGQDVWLR